MEKAGKIISGLLCWAIAAAACVLGFYYAVLPGTLYAETCGAVSGKFCGAEIVERLLPVKTAVDVIAFRCQFFCQNLIQIFLVFRDQNPHDCIHSFVVGCFFIM